MRSRRTEDGSKAGSWLTISGEGMRSGNYPDLLAELFDRKLSGVTVTGVWSTEEARKGLEALDQGRSDRSPAMFGSMLGMPLPELSTVHGHHNLRCPYFDVNDAARVAYCQAFGFDPHRRILMHLSRGASGLAVEAPRDGNRSYSPGNVRWYEPGGRGLPAHAGNEFEAQNDSSTEHLRTLTRTHNHLSYFVVLQQAQAGGELTVWDLEHGQYTPKQTKWGADGRNDDDFDAYPSVQLNPSPGDLVMFGGGWRWHRVNPVRGKQARVTYGGFMGRSVDGSAVHLWF